MFVLVIVNLLGNFLGENDYVFQYKRDDLQLQVCEVQKKVVKDTNYAGAKRINKTIAPGTVLSKGQDGI